MSSFSIRQWAVLAIAGFVSLAGCGVNSAGLGSSDPPDGGTSLDPGKQSVGAFLASSPDAARVSPAPTLKPGVDPSIFLPKPVGGYHPTAEETMTSGKACASDADCATGGGQVVFHCSTPYLGHAQCQGTFPLGDQVVPGVSPSCAYYDCPAGYDCATDTMSHSVTCFYAQ